MRKRCWRKLDPTGLVPGGRTGCSKGVVWIAESVKFFNTLGRRLEPFEPLEPGKVGIYTCGPTVYNTVHIGNLRTFLFEDLLCRSLRFLGFEVTQIMNLTDVDDKTIRGAFEKGLALDVYTAPFIASFAADLATLNVVPAAAYPRATHYIDGMQAIIARLLAAGLRLRERRLGLVPHRRRRRLRQALRIQEGRGPGGGAGRERRVRDRGRARLRAVEGRQARRAQLALALGPRTPGLAHRVLGDERRLPRRDFRHPLRRRRQPLPAPRERDRPERVGERRALRAHLAALGAPDRRRPEDVEVAGQLLHSLRPSGAWHLAARPALPADLGALPAEAQLHFRRAGRSARSVDPARRLHRSGRRMPWSFSRKKKSFQ